MHAHGAEDCVIHCLRHIALDCSHLEKREQLLTEETSRRAVNFIAKKEQLAMELKDVEVSNGCKLHTMCTYVYGSWKSTTLKQCW